MLRRHRRTGRRGRRRGPGAAPAGDRPRARASCGFRWPRRRGEPLVELAERAQEDGRGGAARRCAGSRPGSTSRSGSSRDLAPPGPPAGAVPRLPVGSRRGRDRRRATAARSIRGRASSPRRRSPGRPSSTRASPPPPRAGRPTGSASVERSALRVAIHELDRGDVPQEVAIDEAVGFTKRYASDEAARLVNGILGRIQREAAVTNELRRVARARGGAARRGSRRRARSSRRPTIPSRRSRCCRSSPSSRRQIEAELQRARAAAEADAADA